jgi:hypothetical protein
MSSSLSHDNVAVVEVLGGLDRLLQFWPGLKCPAGGVSGSSSCPMDSRVDAMSEEGVLDPWVVEWIVTNPKRSTPFIDMSPKILELARGPVA